MRVDRNGISVPNTGAKFKVKSDGICPHCGQRTIAELSLNRFVQRCAYCSGTWRVDSHGRPRTNSPMVNAR